MLDLVPSSVRELIAHGHQVLIHAEQVKKLVLMMHLIQMLVRELLIPLKKYIKQADMIIKVKEPQPDECRMLREDQLLFTYLHLAPDPEQAKLLQESGCVAIAYETVTNQNGGLPLLAPMSEVAGRMAIQAGANCLEIKNGGKGMLLGGVPGVVPGKSCGDWWWCSWYKFCACCDGYGRECCRHR